PRRSAPVLGRTPVAFPPTKMIRINVDEAKRKGQALLCKLKSDPVGVVPTLNGREFRSRAMSLDRFSVCRGALLFTVLVSIAWNIAAAQPVIVQAWGRNFYGETDVPTGLTNALAVGAG